VWRLCRTRWLHALWPGRHESTPTVNVKCQDDLDAELTRWGHTLADERFDLLEQITAEMAKAKGVQLPPKFSAAK
jgi:hypothetical protein